MEHIISSARSSIDERRVHVVKKSISKLTYDLPSPKVLSTRFKPEVALLPDTPKKVESNANPGTKLGLTRLFMAETRVRRGSEYWSHGMHAAATRWGTSRRSRNECLVQSARKRGLPLRAEEALNVNLYITAGVRETELFLNNVNSTGNDSTGGRNRAHVEGRKIDFPVILLGVVCTFMLLTLAHYPL